ncbi:MAG: polysaccharide pyruvyl transferase family protein [Tildeniella torsiva UHER 1998/13D]|nr:polysaccharide pyruvyl transferase family protein [Tildeniella torsiva UHER 1998/13D]
MKWVFSHGLDAKDNAQVIIFQDFSLMLFEIRGVHFANKGAELMLHSVLQKVAEWNDQNKLAMRFQLGSFDQRAKLGLRQLFWVDKGLPLIGKSYAQAISLVPKKTRNALGIVTYEDIDVILDASGFAYSDQWGIEKSTRMAELARKAKKMGKKVVLLPQAFGPFENPRKRSEFIKVLENADLVFARDPISYDHLINLSINSTNIRMSPDFTNLVNGAVPGYFDLSVKRACVIPNNRMLDKTSKETKNSYAHFLEYSIQFLLDQRLNPFILLHDNSDRVLISHLKGVFGNQLEVVEEPNPLYVKGILGNCYLVIGSRFHGLISALSQGIPCIGTGWSHKYQMLFQDYDCSSFLISDFQDKDKALYQLNQLVSEPSRSELMNQLHSASKKQKKLSSEMWSEVHKLIYN